MNPQNNSNFNSGNIESKDFYINLRESRSRDSKSKSSSSGEDNCAQIYEAESRVAKRDSDRKIFKSKGRKLKNV